MRIHTNTKVVEVYRELEVIILNPLGAAEYYSVAINGEISDHCLASVKACKNVIDTYLRNIKK